MILQKENNMLNEEIMILNTNDIHSHLENLPKITRYITNQRKNNLLKGVESLTFDIGDALDRFHPLTEATNGKANIQLLNKLKLDGATIGNNEGLTNSHKQLNQLYDEANFDVLLANLVDDQTGEIPNWAQPAKIIVTAAKTRILVVGLTAPYDNTYPLIGWRVQDPFEVMKDILVKYKGQYDIVILLSHLGLPTDRKLAKRFVELDVILGSHTHHLLVNGEVVNQSLLTGAGKWGQHIGTVHLTLNHHKIMQKTAQTISVDLIESKASDEIETNHYQQMGVELLKANQVAKLSFSMTPQLIGNSVIVNEALKAEAHKAHTEAAIINTGLFLRGLPEGIVTQNDIHQMLPHAMRVMKVRLDGYNLWRLIQEMEKNRRFLIKFQQKGMGFRGKYFGELHYYGIRYDYEKHQLFWRGQLVSPIETYEVAMPDHYLYIPFFPTIQIMGENTIYFDEDLRTVFANYLAKQYPIK